MTRLYGTVAFWLLVILPLVGLFQALNCGDRYTFFWGLIIYAIVYRPILNFLRLLELEKISKRDIWKMFIPFWYDVKYSKALWLGEDR